MWHRCMDALQRVRHMWSIDIEPRSCDRAPSGAVFLLYGLLATSLCAVARPVTVCNINAVFISESASCLSHSSVFCSSSLAASMSSSSSCHQSLSSFALSSTSAFCFYALPNFSVLSGESPFPMVSFLFHFSFSITPHAVALSPTVIFSLPSTMKRLSLYDILAQQGHCSYVYYIVARDNFVCGSLPPPCEIPYKF